MTVHTHHIQIFFWDKQRIGKSKNKVNSDYVKYFEGNIAVKEDGSQCRAHQSFVYGVSNLCRIHVSPWIVGSFFYYFETCLWLASNSPCRPGWILCLLSAGIKDVYHRTKPLPFFYMNYSRVCLCVCNYRHPSAMWVSGTELRSSGLVGSTFAQ